jgi:hypothetical protein
MLRYVIAAQFGLRTLSNQLSWKTHFQLSRKITPSHSHVVYRIYFGLAIGRCSSPFPKDFYIVVMVAQVSEIVEVSGILWHQRKSRLI